GASRARAGSRAGARTAARLRARGTFRVSRRTSRPPAGRPARAGLNFDGRRITTVVEVRQGPFSADRPSFPSAPGPPAAGRVAQDLLDAAATLAFPVLVTAHPDRQFEPRGRLAGLHPEPGQDVLEVLVEEVLQHHAGDACSHVLVRAVGMLRTDRQHL